MTSEEVKERWNNLPSDPVSLFVREYVLPLVIAITEELEKEIK